MKSNSQKTKIFLGIFFLFISSIFCSIEGDTSGESQSGSPATISEVEGVIQILREEDGQFSDVVNGDLFGVNNQILTHRNSRARIDLPNGTILRVGPLSHFTLQQLEERSDGPYSKLKLEVGELFVILFGGSTDIDTPAGLASVRGSYMHVYVVPGTKETIIKCLEGLCQIGNGGGAVNLIAGQSASVVNFDSPPTPGKMNNNDVSYWLQYNPEATLAIVPLTQTVAASNETNNSSDTTPTPSATLCPHPENWTAISTTPGDTLDSIATSYGATVEELAEANCLQVSSQLIAGMIIFLPPVIVEVTPTLPPLASLTPTPTSPPGSESNADFRNMVGPVDSINTCENLFTVDVVDPDGVAYVEVEYAVNDPSFNNSKFLRLTYQGENTYKGFFLIYTFDDPGVDTVYWRFVASDAFINQQGFPFFGDPPFSYQDSLNCGGP